MDEQHLVLYSAHEGLHVVVFVGDFRLVRIQILNSAVMSVTVQLRAGQIRILAEAQLEVFHHELAHLLWESALSGELLQDLAEDGRIGQMIVRCKHEQALFLLHLAYNLVRVLLWVTGKRRV